MARDPISGQFLPSGVEPDPRAVRIKWFIDNVLKKLNLSMEQRLGLATNLVRDRVVLNISRRVTIGTGPLGGRRVTDRSKPGQFPKLETGTLQKSIFAEVRRVSSSAAEGHVGTNLDYGLILEQRMDRLLFQKSLMQMLPTVRRVMTKKIN